MKRSIVRMVGLLGALVLLVPAAGPLLRAQAGVELVGVGRIAGDAKDGSRLPGTYTNAQGETIPAAQLGSFGSAITYTGLDNRYYAANDRGFGDGFTRSLDRFHVLDITIDLRAKQVRATLVETRLLTNEAGDGLVGLASDFADDPRQSLRYDPEGLCLGPQGTLFISDEYGPAIDEFAASGRRLRSLPVPAKFRVAQPHADDETETRSNRTGRVTNKGMEGLAITPDGRTLVGIMQGPLIQDGGRQGINCRILTIDADSGATHEYVYPLSSPKCGACEILAIDASRFLVLERDGAGGPKAFARLFQIDLRNGSDIGALGNEADDGLPLSETPAGVTAVTKRPFLDLLEQRFRLAADDFPAKLEGLTWGPDLPDGRRLLLITSDNDLNRTKATLFYAFAVDRADLEDK